MAQKKITDLQLISALGDDVNYLVDDGIQSYRATGLQLKNFVFPSQAVTLAKLSDEVLRKLVPVGSVLNMSTPTVPDGFLKMNGAALSRTTYADLFAYLVTAPGFTAQTFTVTIASPGVVTKTAHGFTGGERLRLSTTGALPTGLSNSVDYFVWYIDANTFRLQTLANLLAGTWVNTSGTQSGTHSFTRSYWGLGDGSTTFNAPDVRGFHPRFWDDGAGIDTSRAFASLQLDAYKSHTHTMRTSGQASNGYNQAAYLSMTSGGHSNFYTSYDTENSVMIQASGGTESRGKNVAFMPVIKY